MATTPYMPTRMANPVAVAEIIINASSKISQVTCGVEQQPWDYLRVLVEVMVPIAFTLIVCVGFLGNLLVIVVIIANIQMRNTTNILIISLALADLAFIVFCVPFTAVTYVKGGWPLGTTLCQIYQYTTYITAYCSVYTLVLMSIDRFLAVVHPIDSMTLRTKQNTIIAVTLVWVIFLVVNIPLFIDSEVVTGGKDESENCFTQYCIYSRLVTRNATTKTADDNKSFGKLYFGLFFMFGYLLPLTVICILYGLLIKRLLFGRTANMAQSGEAMRSKKRVTRMVVIVIVVFALSWLPIQIIFLMQYFGSKDYYSYLFRTIHVISNCLAYANSMINPILYAFLSENFRRAFANFLCIRRHLGRSQTLDYERTNVTKSRLHPAGKCAAESNLLNEDDKENGGEICLLSCKNNGENSAEHLQKTRDKDISPQILIETEIN